jgi:hypothetical protein
MIKLKDILQEQMFLSKHNEIDPQSWEFWKDYFKGNQGLIPGKNTITNMFNQANNVTGIHDKIKNLNVSLHYKLALHFLFMRKSDVTNNDIPNEYISILSDVLCLKSQRNKTCNITGLNYDDYTIHNKNSPSYNKQSFTYNQQPADLKATILSFGNANVKESGNNWIITDTYNFDNIQEKYKFLKTKNFTRIIGNIGIGIFRSILNPIAGIEYMMSQLHNLGYKGFAVKIIVPKNNCKC